MLSTNKMTDQTRKKVFRYAAAILGVSVYIFMMVMSVEITGPLSPGNSKNVHRIVALFWPIGLPMYFMFVNPLTCISVIAASCTSVMWSTRPKVIKPAQKVNQYLEAGKQEAQLIGNAFPD